MYSSFQILIDFLISHSINDFNLKANYLLLFGAKKFLASLLFTGRGMNCNVKKGSPSAALPFSAFQAKRNTIFQTLSYFNSPDATFLAISASFAFALSLVIPTHRNRTAPSTNSAAGAKLITISILVSTSAERFSAFAT